LYKSILKPFLFLLQAERAHHLIFNLLGVLNWIPGLNRLLRHYYTISAPELNRNVFGISFPNPVGLAAGFDKDAKRFRELACFGFGFIEVGTLTPKPQEGNPKPRLFRLPQDEALINRMGFNNGGVQAAVERLKGRKGKIIVGGNIGKNKVTPNAEAVNDYRYCFEALYPVVDYFVVNVSSPNTPNLRELQDKEPLTALLMAVQDMNNATSAPKPVLLKIAPDLTNSQLDDILDIARETKIAGIIATNTTIDRSGLATTAETIESIGAGGLSGKPVLKRSTAVIRYLVEKSNGTIPVVAVGGIFTAEDAWEKIAAGASLVQVYTGFIYEGPAMVKRINKGLLRKYKQKG
jgi:dihydroorotate dehydrogenase